MALFSSRRTGGQATWPNVGFPRFILLRPSVSDLPLGVGVINMCHSTPLPHACNGCRNTRRISHSSSRLPGSGYKLGSPVSLLDEMTAAGHIGRRICHLSPVCRARPYKKRFRTTGGCYAGSRYYRLSGPGCATKGEPQAFHFLVNGVLSNNSSCTALGVLQFRPGVVVGRPYRR